MFTTHPTKEDTMFVAVPVALTWEYNPSMHIHVNCSTIDQLKEALYEPDAKNMLSAFCGITQSRKHLKSTTFGLDYFKKNLLSDHVPVFGVLRTMHKSYALIFTNNASILGQRGLVQHHDLFHPQMTKSLLQQASHKIASTTLCRTCDQLKSLPRCKTRSRKKVYSHLKSLVKTKLKDVF